MCISHYKQIRSFISTVPQNAPRYRVIYFINVYYSTTATHVPGGSFFSCLSSTARNLCSILLRSRLKVKLYLIDYPSNLRLSSIFQGPIYSTRYSLLLKLQDFRRQRFTRYLTLLMLVLLILISQTSLATNHRRTTKHSATKQIYYFRNFG